MSRIRTIKPEFFRSESLGQLPIAVRLTFAGLWTEADDTGCGVANSKALCGALWSQDDEIGPSDVEDHLKLLDKSEHIVLYVVGGKRYFYVLNWDDHQSAAYRRGAGQYPPPPESCKKVQVARVGVLEGKGKEGKGKEGSAARTPRGTAVPDEFPITPALKEWATKTGCDALNLDSETQKFLDHHGAKGSEFKDWDRAWQKWMRQAKDWAKPSTQERTTTKRTMRQPPRPHYCDTCHEYHPPDETCGVIREVIVVDL